MKNLALVAIATAFLLVPTGAVAQDDLFEEAGHGLSRSRYVTVHHFPTVEIALESDDVVLVESKDHPPRSLAMRIDGEAVAADCELTETEDHSYSYEVGNVKDDDGKKKKKTTTSTTTNISNITYRSSCQFPQGTTDRAMDARAITVQVALPKGTTKAYDLSPKALQKLQSLDH